MLLPVRPLSILLTVTVLCPGAASQRMAKGSQAPRMAPEESSQESRAQVPFRILDQTRGASIDLVFAPVRPMALDPSTQRLYAVNTHNNTVSEFHGEATLRQIPVPWGPVSVALWSRSAEQPASVLLVVCRGSYSLACIDLASGNLERLIDLPAEPADILVHPKSNRVFISCQADDSVAELDLGLGHIVARHAVPSKRPTFMTLDGDDVLVAPMLSGNNSIAGSPGVIDLEDPAIAIQGLKDHDLFRITPAGSVLPVARDMGSVLFALGVHPSTGELWQLGTEAKNKDPMRRGEPALRGDFIRNQIAITTLTAAQVVEPSLVLDLDDTDPNTAGVQFDAERSVGQPYGLAFDQEGRAFVAGLLSQNITQLAADGSFLREWNVGSIPRAIQLSPNGERAWVYCWGDNTIESYDLSSAQPTSLGALSLGYDPTPDLEREGRKLFYDASFSMHGNASCASCHIETESDMLAWDLSDLPIDDKGPLLTQTMRGIEALVPLHWRGERAGLVDFNPAFDGLLGGRELDLSPGSEFDQFEAFINSLQQPANPAAHPDRMVDSSPDATGGVPSSGQSIFFSTDPNQGLCSNCHVLPKGTNSEAQRGVTNNTGIARRDFVLVPSFNGLWRRNQPTVESVVMANGRTSRRPTLGSGLLVTGVSTNLPSFLDQFFTLTDQEELDVAAFINQLDSGMAPAAHRSWLLNQGSLDKVAPELEDYLMVQAQRGNADIAVFGELTYGGGRHSLRWVWDRNLASFICEDSRLPARGLNEFLGEASTGRASWTFLGLPVGYGERFAVDFDQDGLFNRDELALGSSPVLSDSDGDGFWDGHETQNGGSPSDPDLTPVDTTAPVISNLRLVYRTARMAKLQFDTSEPTRIDASWATNFPVGSSSGSAFAKSHTLILSELTYRKRYSVNVGATDLAGNRSTMNLPGTLRTLAAVDPSASVLRNISIDMQQNSGGVLQFSMTGQGHAKVGGRPSFGSRLKVRVYVNGVLSRTVNGTQAGQDGFTTVNIRESGLSVGDVVRVVVDTLGILSWNMPETLPANRERSFIYDGSGI